MATAELSATEVRDAINALTPAEKAALLAALTQKRALDPAALATPARTATRSSRYEQTLALALRTASKMGALTVAELNALDFIGVSRLTTVERDQDGNITKISHMPNTARIALMLIESDSGDRERLGFGVYHTNAQGIDCAEPTIYTPRDFFDNVFAVEQLNRTEVYPVTRGRRLNRATNAWVSTGTEKTFCFAFDFGEGLNEYRVFAPAVVTRLLIDRFDPNSDTQDAWDALLAKTYNESGDLLSPMVKIYHAAINIMRTMGVTRVCLTNHGSNQRIMEASTNIAR